MVVHWNIKIMKLPFDVSNNMQILHSSKGCYWNDMSAVLTKEKPHEGQRFPLPTLWIALAVDPSEVCRSVDNQIFQSRVSSDRVIITPPEQKVTDTLLRETRTLHLFMKDDLLQVVSQERLQRKFNDFSFVSSFDMEDKTLVYLLRAAKQMLIEAEGSHWRSEYLSQAIAAHLLDRYAMIEGFKIDVDVTPMPRFKLHRVEEFMKNNLNAEFSYSDLAASVGLSRTAFFNRFSKSTQMTPHQFLQNLRIRKARNLLRYSNNTIAEIAILCGYSDQAHLSRYFKRVVGIGPGRYRKEFE